NAPVVNVHEGVSRLADLNRGNRTVGPFRWPFRLAFQLLNPSARFANPDEYASFELSAHHGATSCFAWFQSLRKLNADQFRLGVNSCLGTPYDRSASR